MSWWPFVSFESRRILGQWTLSLPFFLILGLAAFEAWEANAFPVMLLFLPFFASAIAAAHLQADRGSGALDFILKQNLSLPQILWLRFAFGLILPSLGSLLVLLPLLVRGQLQAGQLVWY